MSSKISALPDLPESASIEILKDEHDILALNGTGQEASQYVVMKKFSSNEEIVAAITKISKNMANAIAFGNFGSEDPEDKEVKAKFMPHMPAEKIKEYLDTKDAAVRKNILSKTVEYLMQIHDAKINAQRIKEKVDTAKKVIDSGTEVLANTTNADKELSKKLQSNVSLLNKEISGKHPKEETIDALILEITSNSEALIGSGEIIEAVQLVDDFINLANMTLTEDHINNEVRDSFKKEFVSLEKLKTEGNPFAMKAAVERLGKILFEKTSKEIVAKDQAVLIVAGTMERFLLQNFFVIENATYSELLKKIFEDSLTSSFDEFKKGLGRFGDLEDPIQTYGLILKGVLQTAVAEMLIIHDKKTNIDSVKLPKEYVPWSYVIDKVLIEMQSKMLEISKADVKVTEKRLEATKKFLAKVKSTLKVHLVNESGIDEITAKNVTEGPLFNVAINEVPGVVSKNFFAFRNEKIEEGVNKDDATRE